MSKYFTVCIFLCIFFYRLNSSADALSWFSVPTIEDIVKKKYISIVYVSQNLKSPISMFGHTFLVAHNDEIPEPDALTIEFLGDTKQSNYSHLGALFDSIPGYYKLNHFLIKQREYETEDRDLWVYKLKISEERRKQFLINVDARLRQGFRYSFVTKNCSYYVYDLIVKSENFDSAAGDFYYTIPIETIRRLKVQDQILDVIYLPSAQKKLLHQYSQLDAAELKQFKTIFSGQSVEKIEISERLRLALSMAISYRIPRESELEKRTNLYSLKKEYYEAFEEKNGYTESDPAGVFGETALSSMYDFKNDYFGIIFKPAQRDFFTSKNDGLETSYLEIAKAEIYFKNNKLNLAQFNLFKLDSIKEGTVFSESFNRLIDLSFYNWSLVSSKTAFEEVVRIGAGWSAEFSFFRLGLIPYIGLRSYNNDATGLDLGSKFIFNQRISNKFRLEESYLYYLNSPFTFDGIISASGIYKISQKYSLGLSYLSTNRNENFQLKGQFILLF